MNSSKTIHLLLVCMMGCAGGISCKSSQSQAVVGKGKPQNDKRVLAEQEMIDIATAVGRQYDRDPAEWEAVVDEGKAEWREYAVWLLWRPNRDKDGNPMPRPTVSDDELEAAVLKRWPMLKGHDYQVLWYSWRSPGFVAMVDMARAILIDRNTGEILLALGQWGDVLKPNGR
jgi:hypothetical protein